MIYTSKQLFYLLRWRMGEPACTAAVRWAGKKSLEKVWFSCPRADWLLWLAARLGVSRTLMLRAVRGCLKLAPKKTRMELLKYLDRESFCFSLWSDVDSAAYGAADAEALGFSFRRWDIAYRRSLKNMARVVRAFIKFEIIQKKVGEMEKKFAIKKKKK